MATSAGIVNRDGRANDAAFRQAVAGSPAEVQQLAHAVCDLVGSGRSPKPGRGLRRLGS